MALQVRRRSAQDALIVRQLARNQIGSDIVADADIQIEPFADQIHQPIGHVEPQLQLRILPRQRRQRRRHETPAEAEAADHAQHALRRLAHLGQLVHHLIDVVENALRPFVDAFAVFGDRHPPRGAVQQRHVQRLFQQRNAFADEGRRHAQLFGGGGKPGAARHQHEHPQVTQDRHIVHDSCFMFHRFRD